MKKVFALILLCFITNLSADELPDLGDSSASALSPLDERRIANSIMRDVMSSSQVVSDPDIVDYVQDLGRRLVDSSSGRFETFNFFVVNDNSINAFAMPGGVIGVHTGLITSANSEDEVASVLGHEIGHVLQRHLARMLAKQKTDSIINIAGMGLALLAARANPQLSQAAFTASSAAGIQRQLDYTREYEREADRIGLQILDRAGFDTRAMPIFFETLQKGSRFAEGSAPSFLRTHPLTSERIADVKNRVDQFAVRVTKNSEGFYYVRAKILAHLGNAYDAIALFKGNIADNKDNLAVAHYGLAIAAMRNNELKTANNEFDWLQSHNVTNHFISNLSAEIAITQKNSTLAGERYLAGMQLYPNARSLMYGNANLLLSLNKTKQAIDFIKDKQLSWSSDATLYELLSRAYTMQGKQLLRHQAQAEAYYRRYNLSDAIQQMDLAVRAKDGDFYQQSSVEARLKELRLQALPDNS